MTADTRKRAIGLKMGVTARQMRNLFDHMVERDGLSRGKWKLLAAVSRMPGSTQRSIAALLEITDATAGQLIDRLCADGILERREHPADRRAYCVYLTKAAEPLLARLDEVGKRLEEEAFAGLDERDLARLDELLDAIARNVAASCRDPSDEHEC